MGASFVAVASTEAFRGSSYLAAYTASKHGVVGLVRAASRALALEGIRVNAVCAGAMDTPMMSRALADAGGEPLRQQMIAGDTARLHCRSQGGRVCHPIPAFAGGFVRDGRRGSRRRWHARVHALARGPARLADVFL